MRIAVIELAPGRGDWILRSLELCSRSDARLEVDVIAAHQGKIALAHDIDGVIGSGGPGSVACAIDTAETPESLRTARHLLQVALDRKTPTLGICMSHQLIAVAQGGNVRERPAGRIAKVEAVTRTPESFLDPLWSGLPQVVPLAESHRDEVHVAPPGWVVTARSASCAIEAMRSLDGPIWTIQAHPELPADALLDRYGLRPSPKSPLWLYDQWRLKILCNFLAVVSRSSSCGLGEQPSDGPGYST